VLRDNLSELFKALRHLRVDIFGSISFENMVTVENIMQFLTVIDQFVTAYFTALCFTILYVLWALSFITSFIVFTDRMYSVHI